MKDEKSKDQEYFDILNFIDNEITYYEKLTKESHSEFDPRLMGPDGSCRSAYHPSKKPQYEKVIKMLKKARSGLVDVVSHMGVEFACHDFGFTGSIDFSKFKKDSKN